MKRDDMWGTMGFEAHPEAGGYGGFELQPDGSLEINVCEPRTPDMSWYEHPDDATLILPPEHAVEFIAGLQAWIEQL